MPMVTLAGWDQLLQQYKDKEWKFDDPGNRKNINWLFRGEKEADGLKTKFDKAAESFELDNTLKEIDKRENKTLKRFTFENWMLRKFVRQSYLYIDPPHAIFSRKERDEDELFNKKILPKLRNMLEPEEFKILSKKLDKEK